MDTKTPEQKFSARLVVASSPHLRAVDSVPGIMHTVVMALLPAVAASVYYFGPRALLIIVVAVVSCLATEYGVQKIRKKPVTIYDGSAVITGMLLGLTLPAGFPLFGVFLGSFFAIAVGKQLFGGLGYNIFNPALLGRAFMQAAYPVLITTWVSPRTADRAVDVVTAATPLAMWKFEAKATLLTDLFFGNVAGSIGETSVAAILIGGLYLRWKGYVNWKLPLGYLGSMAAVSGVFWLYDPLKYANPLFHLFAGGAMLGAWFMVTDMVTSPVTPIGQWIFAIGGGVLAIIIRLFGGLPEGVMYSILFMNAFVPLINKHTRPRVFGAGMKE